VSALRSFGSLGFWADNCGTITDCFSSAKGLLTALAAVLIVAGIAAIIFSGGAALPLLPGLFELGGATAAGEGLLVSSGALAINSEVAAALAAQGIRAIAGTAATGLGITLMESAGQGGSSSGSGSSGGGGGEAPGRSLGEDPSQGGAFRQGEYDTAVRVQNETGVQLTRSADEAVDWVDSAGKTYDAVGNFPSRFFDQQWPNLQTKILEHMAKADYVPVDVAQFTPEQVQLVKTFIERLGPRVFLVGE
jgi:hypothetical protein